MLVILPNDVATDLEALDHFGLQLVHPLVHADGCGLDTQDERAIADWTIGADKTEVVGHIGNNDAKVSAWVLLCPLCSKVDTVPANYGKGGLERGVEPGGTDDDIRFLLFAGLCQMPFSVMRWILSPWISMLSWTTASRKPGPGVCLLQPIGKSGRRYCAALRPFSPLGHALAEELSGLCLDFGVGNVPMEVLTTPIH